MEPTPWRNDTERALWVLSDTCVLRIPEPSDSYTMRLIDDLYVQQTTYNRQGQSFWKHRRILIGKYDDNGEFVTLHTLKREEAIEFVEKYGAT